MGSGNEEKVLICFLAGGGVSESFYFNSSFEDLVYGGIVTDYCAIIMGGCEDKDAMHRGGGNALF